MRADKQLNCVCCKCGQEQTETEKLVIAAEFYCGSSCSNTAATLQQHQQQRINPAGTSLWPNSIDSAAHSMKLSFSVRY